jgi:hypothetical protein
VLIAQAFEQHLAPVFPLRKLSKQGCLKGEIMQYRLSKAEAGSRSIAGLLVISLIAFALPARLDARRDPTDYADTECVFGNGWHCWSGAQKALVVGGLAVLAVSVVSLVAKKSKDTPPPKPNPSIALPPVTEYRPSRALPQWLANPSAIAAALELHSTTPDPGVQAHGNGARGKRVARVVAGLAMVGGGAALAKWGYDRPHEVRTFEVCTGPSFAPNIPGVPAALQQQINNLGNRCEQRSEDVGRTGTAVGAMLAGAGLATIGTAVAIWP